MSAGRSPRELTEPSGRRRLSLPGLLGLIAAFLLIPQLVSLFMFGVDLSLFSHDVGTVGAPLSDGAFALFLLEVVLLVLVVVRHRGIEPTPVVARHAG